MATLCAHTLFKQGKMCNGYDFCAHNGHCASSG
jgi:hypothetical protein